LKCDGTRAETRFLLSEKRTSPFKLAGASVHSNTGSRGVSITGSNVGHTMFRDSVKSTGYPLHSPVSPSIPLPCVTVWHHISTGLYQTLHETKLYTSRTPSILLTHHALFLYHIMFSWQATDADLCYVLTYGPWRY